MSGDLHRRFVKSDVEEALAQLRNEFSPRY
jgi:hypothetical protein